MLHFHAIPNISFFLEELAMLQIQGRYYKPTSSDVPLENIPEQLNLRSLEDTLFHFVLINIQGAPDGNRLLRLGGNLGRVRHT